MCRASAYACVCECLIRSPTASPCPAQQFHGTRTPELYSASRSYQEPKRSTTMGTSKSRAHQRDPKRKSRGDFKKPSAPKGSKTSLTCRLALPTCLQTCQTCRANCLLTCREDGLSKKNDFSLVKGVIQPPDLDVLLMTFFDVSVQHAVTCHAITYKPL